MERSPRAPPPTTHSSSTTSNGLHQTITTTRSEPSSPFPTTFVQADTSSFKQVVQMLTGSSEISKLASQSKPTSPPPDKNPIPPIRPSSKSKPSKLFERRNSLKSLRISPLVPGFGSNFSPRHAEILSPSLLDFPSLALSPVNPLIPDPFNRSPGPNWTPNRAAEEKAIAEKGFYLHPSPRESEPPKLLPLFPVTSPKLSGAMKAEVLLEEVLNLWSTWMMGSVVEVMVINDKLLENGTCVIRS